MRLAVLALALAVALLTGGCGAPKVANGKTVLYFSMWDGDESMRVIRKLVKQFEAENPDIEVRFVNISDYNSYHQKMMVMYAGNAAVDVAMEDPGHFQALANRGALLPLNQFYEHDKSFDINDYYKPIVDALSLDGKLYVLPRDIAPSGLLYYNKEMFKAAGLPYPDGSWTWDFKERPELKNKDFLWVLEQLTKRGPDGKVTTYGVTPNWEGNLPFNFEYSYGNYWCDNPEHPTKVLCGSPDWIKVADFVHDLEANKEWAPGQLEVNSVLQSAAWQLFVDKKTAMLLDGIWDVPQIRKAMKPTDKGFFDWDVTLFPSYVGKPRHMTTGGSGYAIFSSCKHPQEAWRLTRFMAGPVGMAAMARAGIAQPAIRKIALSQAWLPGPNTPLEQQYPKNRIVTDEAVSAVVFDPTSEFWPDVSGQISGKLDNYYNFIDPASKAFTEGAALGQKRLDYVRQQRSQPLFNWYIGGALGFAIALAIVTIIYWPERYKPYTTRMKLESRSAYRFLTPWLIGLIGLTIGPMIVSILSSTTDWDMIRPAQWRGAGNFVEAATIDPVFWVSLKVTFIYTLVRVPLGIAFALVLALLLNQKVRGIPLFRACYYVPSLVSAVASSLVWQKMFAPDDGLINRVLYSPFVARFLPIGHWLSEIGQTPGKNINWLGNEHTALASFILMSVWGVGGAMVILLAGLQGIPEYYYEAATVDGASPWQRFKAITTPLLTPAIFFTLVTGLIGAFQQFTDVYVITSSGGGPNNATMLYMLNVFNAAFQNYRFGYAAALAWVLFAIILGFTLAQMKLSKWVYYESEGR
ncbi:MAG: extracellular solute-binding protein [Fimbriimonadaceae bacterium]